MKFNELMDKLMPRTLRRTEREKRFRLFLAWFLKLNRSNTSEGAKLDREVRAYFDSMQTNYIFDPIVPPGLLLQHRRPWKEYYDFWYKNHLTAIRAASGSAGGRPKTKGKLKASKKS